jgi:hypothetical protein
MRTTRTCGENCEGNESAAELELAATMATMAQRTTACGGATKRHGKDLAPIK